MNKVLNKKWKSHYAKLYEESLTKVSPKINLSPISEDLSPFYHTLKQVRSRYTILNRIGRGGSKSIYKAIDERANREVAFAKPRDDLPLERYDDFLKEALITAKLDHPNIIKIFDLGINKKGIPYFCMDLKTGQSIKHLIKQPKDKLPSLKDRLRIFIKVCDAIEYSHSKNVLHLDIKPSNIQVGAFGEVQVCDWGLAEVNRQNLKDSNPCFLDPDLFGNDAKIKGTPGFMAPEQSDPEIPHTEKTDIYSLGRLLQSMICCSNSKSAAIQTSSLSAIVNKATSINPESRYTSVSELKRDTLRFLESRPTSVEPGGVVKEIKLLYRRKKVIFNLTFISLFIISFLFLVFHSELQESQIKTTKAMEETKEISKQLKFQIESTEVMLNQSLVDHNVEELKTFLHHEYYSKYLLDESIEILKNILKNKDLDQKETYSLLGELSFISQNFNGAARYWELSSKESTLKILFAKDYANLKKDRPFLTNKDFMNLIIEMEQFNKGFSEKMLIYDHIHRENWEEKAEAITTLLKSRNPSWPLENTRWDESKKLLELDCKNLNQVTSEINPHLIPNNSLLKTLPIDILVLKNANHQLLKDFIRVDPVELHLLNMDDLQPELLNKFSRLKKLVVDGSLEKLHLENSLKYVDISYR